MLKKLLLIIIFTLLSSIATIASDDKKDDSHKYKYGSDNPIENTSSQSTNSKKVYICTGPNAYAYHLNKNCRGLKRCSCEIRHVSREEAKRLKYTKPCGLCAKGQPHLR